MRLNADKLFGTNFDVTVFKDNHGARQIAKKDEDDIDIEHELIGQEHLSYEQRQEFIAEIYKRKSEKEESMMSAFFDQKKLMKVLQDYLYTKYQFATLKPRMLNNKRQKAD